MKQLLLSLGLGYLLLCLCLFMVQRRFQYFPTPALTLPGADQVSFRHGDLVLRGYVANPGQAKALLYFGGNGEQVEQNLVQFRQWFPHHSVYLIPYRGYGNSDGTPSEAGIVQDALFLFDQLNRSHRAVAVMGRSLGAAVAVQVAAHKPVERVVLITPFDSALNIARSLYWMFPLSLLMRDPYQAAALAPLIQAPSYVVIAAQDEVVPAERTQAMVEALAPSLRWSRVIQGAGHNTLSMFPDYGHTLQRAINGEG
ncbi:alpha/beta hydrolase [Ferrimonas sediminicola]|uniref:Alpha/beta hydrolase n=1 Tax=Ferrimonas sediminicola TaxID=2569538 RepID=A0A4V5NVJ5_9GAMM|nr:alpha/beta hydrolase [Ferrimonas sediminicola]TKB49919.1 alpha/beta hydrolase [Ferrimonas sediminicola]